MVYIQGVAEQTRLFLLSIGFGFLLGILYDIFRTVRLVISDSKGFVIFMDLLYFAFCTFLNFCYLLTIDYGKIRFYIVFAELLGWLIYYFSFGAVAIRLSSAITTFIRGIFSRLFCTEGKVNTYETIISKKANRKHILAECFVIIFLLFSGDENFVRKTSPRLNIILYQYVPKVK